MTDKFSGLICDTSQHAKDVQKQRFDEWAKGDVAESGNHKSYKVLSPGVALDDMNRTMIGTLAGEIGKSFKEKGDDAVLKVGLYQWMRDIVTIATTDGVYGDKNPYRDPTVAKDYWSVQYITNHLFSSVKLTNSPGRTNPPSPSSPSDSSPPFSPAPPI